MAIYTEITASLLNELLADYDIGELKAHTGIADGIENTTYRIDTTDGGQERQFILTVFERQHFEDLSYFIEVMRYLGNSPLPCAQPVADKNGIYLKTLQQKPALLTVFLPGTTVTDTNDAQRCEVGRHLALMHRGMEGFSLHRANDRGLDWCMTQLTQLTPIVDQDLAHLLSDELEHQNNCALHDEQSIPNGIIHTDLFRDNVLFDGDTLTGIIDFYYSCNGILLYDLAVVINDWCRKDDHTVDHDSAQLIVKSYCDTRPLTEKETGMLNDALRLAALRFLVSRLTDLHFPREGHTTHIKDPEVFRALLTDYRNNPLAIIH